MRTYKFQLYLTVIVTVLMFTNILALTNQLDQDLVFIISHLFFFILTISQIFINASNLWSEKRVKERMIYFIGISIYGSFLFFSAKTVGTIYEEIQGKGAKSLTALEDYEVISQILGMIFALTFAFYSTKIAKLDESKDKSIEEHLIE